MNEIRLTPHASTRLAQRALGQRDLDLIRQFGTEVEGGFLLRQKDYEAFEHQQKHICDRIKRLVGTRIVADGDLVITAYKANRNKQRRLLRHAEG